jgi:ubiquinol-cytochrome c reductase cytochrome b subunit
MFRRLISWIDERWPLTSLLRLGLEEEIVGGARYAYTLGSAIIFVFTIQAVTGVWQLFYYVPTTAEAYNSLNYLRTDVPFGWLIHGLHYWGANAMIVLLVLHMCRVFIWGAYKNPREITWLVGVVLFLLSLALMFTGACLPWDERGYWASQVGTSIASTVPIVGELVKQLMRGGDSMGQLTLSRFFVTHVAILPTLLVATILVHLIALRKFGESGPWDERERGHTGPFWPDQIFMDTIVSMFLFVILVALCVFSPPPFSGPADPLDFTYLPKPEWSFLFLYQALKYFKGPLEPVGTVGIPLVGVLMLILAPFIDRGEERSPLHRPVAMTIGLIVLAGTLTLTVMGYYSHPGASAAHIASTTPPGEASTAPSPGAKQGAQLFASLGCGGCHTVNGVGGTLGPNLSNEGDMGRTRQWLEAQIRAPRSHDPQSIMPAFDKLGDQQLNELIDYLLSLKRTNTPEQGASPAGVPTTTASGSGGAAPPCAATTPGVSAYTIGSVEHGRSLFNGYCVACHGPQGTDKVPNPGSESGKVPPLNPISRSLFSNDPETFAEAIDRVIQHGSVPAGPNPTLTMQAFGDRNSLTQQQISDIEAYVLYLNGVDRAELRHPGMEPLHFFILVVGAFFLAGIVLLVLWKRLDGGSGGKDDDTE